jgi:oligopeptide/dipeptide ABC transporter ATP-binding protein
MTPLLSVKNLSIRIKNQTFVKDINFDLYEQECLGIVGESGCGKSLTAQAIACLSRHQLSGSIFFKNQNILSLAESEKREIRAKSIGTIFQNPQSCLNPTMKVGKQIQESYTQMQRQDVIEWLKKVNLTNPERCYEAYPHELSGGICQRIMIAIAMAKKPELLIADEPTTALDMSTQMQIVDLIKSLMQLHKMSTLFITHDFHVLKQLCQRVIVMYAGEIVETGLLKDVLENPKHPYTQALLEARPRLGEGKKQLLKAIPGSPPLYTQNIKGCHFANRCPSPYKICTLEKPQVHENVACWKYVDRAS